MKRVVRFRMEESDFALLEAEAKDRGLPISDLARSATLADIRKRVGRTNLLDALEKRIEGLVRRVCEEERKIIREQGENAPTARCARARGVVGEG